MKCKFLAVSALLTVLALWMAPAQAQQKNDNKKEVLSGSLNVTTNGPDGEGEANVNYVEDGHRYKIRLKGSKISEMSVDGKIVPAEEYTKYEPLVKKILAQIERDREQASKDREQAERDREQAAKDRLQAQKDRQQADKDREQASQDRKRAEEDRAQSERDREQAKKDRAQAELDRQQAVKDRKQAEEDRKLLNAMIDELIKEKLVESREALTSLELDDTKLVINGKAQSESIHSHFKETYLKGKHNQINYRNSGGSRMMQVN